MSRNEVQLESFEPLAGQSKVHEETSPRFPASFERFPLAALTRVRLECRRFHVFGFAKPRSKAWQRAPTQRKMLPTNLIWFYLVSTPRIKHRFLLEKQSPNTKKPRHTWGQFPGPLGMLKSYLSYLGVESLLGESLNSFAPTGPDF